MTGKASALFCYTKRTQLKNMRKTKPILRVCINGHKFFKGSDCSICPTCEEERKPKGNFLSLIAAPARRALEREGITNLKKLSTYSEREILNLHGLGKSALTKLKITLKTEGLLFKNQNRIINQEYKSYNKSLNSVDKQICDLLALTINNELFEAENKIWHGHPVWFLDDNPTVGYSKQKKGIRLMFWSGADFNEENLILKGQKFKDASVFFNSAEEVNTIELMRWLKKSRKIQWDYKNIIKRKGKLERLK